VANLGSFDLQLDSVSKSFGSVRVVSGVSFGLAKGEFLALLGPSGCGKTTTLSMVAGFERPDSGSIAIRAKRVEALPPERRDIGMVFQNYALFPHMSVAANIAFGLKMRGRSKADIEPRVQSIAELVKVEHLLSRQPRELSGGQQQRVALARALIVEPAILLLDEPFGALDRQLREDLQVEVRSLLRRLEITTVFVTHDQDEALSMSDRIAVMSGGRIEQIASPRALYEAPATRNVAAFIGKGTFITGKVAGGEAPILKTTIGEFLLPLQVKSSLNDRMVDYFLRPEQIHLTEADCAWSNRVSGAVTATTFLGDRQQIIVDVQDSVRFLVKVEQSCAPKIGDLVWLGWNEEDALIFHDGQRL
jgi:ABC-type Fe3+/spermidine/putrescine transport system ATPase subunit